MGWVHSVNIAMVRTGEWTGRMGRTGIDKRPVSEPLVLDGPATQGQDGSGVRGDTVVDARFHGGAEKAVYAYDLEELVHWSEVMGRELAPGMAGENLTLCEFHSSDSVIGERWRVGSAVLRVTVPRTPCRVFAGFWDIDDLVKRFTDHGRTGTYLTVEEQGEIRAGDAVEVLSRPEHGVTVAEVFAFRSRGQRELVSHVARAEAHLPERFRDHLNRVRAQLAS